jgi:hypothetical protein
LAGIPESDSQRQQSRATDSGDSAFTPIAKVGGKKAGGQK